MVGAVLFDKCFSLSSLLREKSSIYILFSFNLAYAISITSVENSVFLIKSVSNKSTLTLNWNHGSIPKYKFYKVDILKIMAQMIKINGIAFDFINNHDIDEIWSGWLPLNSIKILEKI